MNTTAPATIPDDAHTALEVETLQAVLVGALHQLAVELVVLRQLAAATNVRARGFMTHEAREAQDAIIRKWNAEDARLRDEARDRPLPPNPLPKMSASQAPVKVSALDLMAGIHQDLISNDIGAWKIILKHQHTNPPTFGPLCADRACRHESCARARTPARRSFSPEVNDTHFLAHLIDLVQYVNDATWLGRALRDVENHQKAIHRFVHGEATAKLQARCPWCGERSLTVFIDQGVIVCGKSHDTGRYSTCICPFATCHCKDRWHRHNWVQGTEEGKGEWATLLKQINDADRQRAAEAAALAVAKRQAAMNLALAIIAGDPIGHDA